MTNVAQNEAIAILLVEDEALVRMFVADMLREEGGFKVVEAVNAEEALTILEATSDVQVIVTDVEMPGRMNGFALARLVRETWPRIGIVITSGRREPESGEMPDGGLYLGKPYAPDALIQAVTSVAGPGPIKPDIRRTMAVGQSAQLVTMDRLDGSVNGMAQPLPESEG